MRATRQVVLAHTQVLSQLERNQASIELIERVVAGATDPALEVVRQRLKSGETLPFDVITTPADGIAEVFFTVAGVLNTSQGDLNVLTFARLAEAMGVEAEKLEHAVSPELH